MLSYFTVAESKSEEANAHHGGDGGRGIQTEKIFPLTNREEFYLVEFLSSRVLLIRDSPSYIYLNQYGNY